MKKVIVIIAVIIILAVAAWLFFYSNEEAPDQEQEPNEEEEVAQNENEEEDNDAEGDEEDNPYDTAETVEPMAERNVVMDEDIREVLGEVFEKEPKLVESGDILILSYVVDRTITSDDVTEIKDLLQEKDYELEGTDARENEYDLNFSAEILDQEYNGNIYVLVHTAEEGENAQKIEVRIL
ncbi:MAG: hypothetical protein ACQEP6_01655 [Patescibacteria group bacterium]